MSKYKITFIELNLPFNVPAFKNRKKFNRKTKCLYTDPEVKEKMQIIENRLYATRSEFQIIKKETSIMPFALLMTVLIE